MTELQAQLAQANDQLSETVKMYNQASGIERFGGFLGFVGFMVRGGGPRHNMMCAHGAATCTPHAQVVQDLNRQVAEAHDQAEAVQKLSDAKVGTAHGMLVGRRCAC